MGRDYMKKIIELFLTFFKLGLFTFGGGYAMIPQIKDIIVDKKNWLTNDEVLEIIFREKDVYFIDCDNFQ